MNSNLAQLIADYQAHVAKAVALLERSGVPRPQSNTEWASLQTLPSPDLGDGFIARKHGYGCSVRGPAWAVDFDFGDTGQIDGFDAWRLEKFAENRLVQYGFESPQDVRTAFERARACGDIVYSGYILYYLATTNDPQPPLGGSDAPRHATSEETNNVIAIFHGDDAETHEAFQEWRRANTNGFDMTEGPRGTFTIHFAQDKRENPEGRGCWHQGGSGNAYRADKDGCYTTARKVCSNSVAELTTWAEAHGYKTKKCGHCNTKEFKL